jgi:hypothetical protein
MNGYRYWVERHRLAAWLEEERLRAASLPERERRAKELVAEREFRLKLDALYGQVRAEFEHAKA